MTIHVNTDTLQHGQPHIVQWCAFIEDKVLPQFKIGTSTGDQRRWVVEIMDGANIGTKGQSDMIKQAAACLLYPSDAADE